MLLEPGHQLVVDRRLDERAHICVPELRFCLAFELGLGQLDGHDRRQALPNVLPDEVLFLLLQEGLGPGVAVDHVGQGLLESLLVHPAFVSVNSISKSVDGLGIACVPLHGHFHFARFSLGFEVDHLAVKCLLAPREVPNEVRQAARGLEHLLRRRVLPFVDEDDLHPADQECLLLHTFGQDLPLELERVGEDLRIGPERDDRSGLRGRLDLAQPGRWHASFEGLLPHEAVPCDLHHQPPGQGIHHGNAHAVKPAGHRIRLPTELPTGVQRGQDHLHGRLAILPSRDRTDRNPAAVVDHTTPAVGQQLDHDLGAEPSEGFVDGVVHDLVHQVVEAPWTGAPDVHTGAFPNRLKTFEFVDLGGIVFLRRIDAYHSLRRRKFGRQFVIGFRHRRWSRDHSIER